MSPSPPEAMPSRQRLLMGANYWSPSASSRCRQSHRRQESRLRIASCVRRREVVSEQSYAVAIVSFPPSSPHEGKAVSAMA